MAPEDADAVRAALRSDDAEGPEEEWLELEGESAEADPAESEVEIARLQNEIAASRLRQAVLERYIEALGD
jgi:Arc/MetJ-type ribon-helix-helix transcriptional regulator